MIRPFLITLGIAVAGSLCWFAFAAGLEPGAPGAPQPVAATPPSAPATAPRTAEEKAQSCAMCHGKEGIATQEGFPHLAGQTARYLAFQMKGYRDQPARRVPLMYAQMLDLDDAEIAAFAARYAAATPARPAVAPRAGDPARGAFLSVACAGCHGPRGVPANPWWPALAGQDAAYIAFKLRAFRSAEEMREPVMKAVAWFLSEADMRDLAAYYASLPPRPAEGR